MSDDRRQRLMVRVRHWSDLMGAQPRIVRVRRMTRKWGSCSAAGVITLAEDLAEQSPEFQDFVIAHELLHLRVPRHGKVFNALMSAHVPGWRTQEMLR